MHLSRFSPLVLVVATVFSTTAAPTLWAKTKIVIIAGEKSHPSGQHEFAAGSDILARALNEQSGLDIEAVVVKSGWPKDEAVFTDAKALVCYADGGPKHPFVAHLDKVDALAKQGVGIMCMHYGVEVVPQQAGAQFTRWIGGFYEGGYSVNPHWDAEAQPTKLHPVSRGVQPVKVHDEWYFRIRFPEPTDAVPLMQATPTRALIKRYIHWNQGADAELGKPQTMMWGLQRAGGGRGVGFTGGHWHRNWAIDDFRKLVLNGIVGVAGQEVPEAGVTSKALTEADLNTGLDPKEPMVQVQLPTPADFELP
ncbi:MAG: ThuA domain-containing protein, partial [Roseimicrobium sp.]